MDVVALTALLAAKTDTINGRILLEFQNVVGQISPCNPAILALNDENMPDGARIGQRPTRELLGLVHFRHGMPVDC
ncbi:hypothetical protein ELI47_37920 [Rhizobium ruizarguesonis]|uniref:hypothetical protein n=1 Tax=Rhizobium ruizarguesonis TaxID=2081791 RepID=UPI00102F6B7E|nr:hypothetical protein [Rhizobium ruizarguesonis]TAU15506.1 hypothetical protein ELI47_37920 [Rhizobium ruizarguesonis]